MRRSTAVIRAATVWERFGLSSHRGDDVQSRDGDQSRDRQGAVRSGFVTGVAWRSCEANRFLTGAALKGRALRFGFTQLELLVVLGLVLLLVAILLPSVQNVREAARRMSCQSNLAQLSLAIQNYEMAFEVLPPGTVNATGPIVNRPAPNAYHVSWMVAILPQLELSMVYNRFDFTRSVYDLRNSPAQGASISILSCPSGGGYAASHHGSEAPIDDDNDGCFFLNSSVTYDDVTDGASHTIALGESQGMGRVWGWASGTRDTLRNTGLPPNAPDVATPNGMYLEMDFSRGSRGWDAMLGPPEDAAARSDPVLLFVGGFGSRHAGGAQFAMCDGSIRFISDSIDLQVYRSLGSRNDGAMPADAFAGQ